jgi:pterin-4a-carbinolamine dehydratase
MFRISSRKSFSGVNLHKVARPCPLPHKTNSIKCFSSSQGFLRKRSQKYPPGLFNLIDQSEGLREAIPSSHDIAPSTDEESVQSPQDSIGNSNAATNQEFPIHKPPLFTGRPLDAVRWTRKFEEEASKDHKQSLQLLMQHRWELRTLLKDPAFMFPLPSKKGAKSSNGTPPKLVQSLSKKIEIPFEKRNILPKFIRLLMNFADTVNHHPHAVVANGRDLYIEWTTHRDSLTKASGISPLDIRCATFTDRLHKALLSSNPYSHATSLEPRHQWTKLTKPSSTLWNAVDPLPIPPPFYLTARANSILVEPESAFKSQSAEQQAKALTTLRIYLRSLNIAAKLLKSRSITRKNRIEKATSFVDQVDNSATTITTGISTNSDPALDERVKAIQLENYLSTRKEAQEELNILNTALETCNTEKTKVTKRYASMREVMISSSSSSSSSSPSGLHNGRSGEVVLAEEDLDVDDLEDSILSEVFSEVDDYNYDSADAADAADATSIDTSSPQDAKQIPSSKEAYPLPRKAKLDRKRPKPFAQQ